MIDPRDRAEAIITLMSIQSPNGKIDVDLLTQELSEMQQSGIKEAESKKSPDLVNEIVSLQDKIDELEDILETIMMQAHIAIKVTDLNYVDLRDTLVSIKENAISVLKYKEIDLDDSVEM